MLTSRVQGFKPSDNAFHFPNTFDPGPVFTIPVPLFGRIPIGTAVGGMCGGMVFTVLDTFHAGLTMPAHTTAPKPGTRLFQYLASRLLTSFNGVSGILKYLEWMRFGDEGIAWHTVNDEWPAIQTDLDKGRACPLGVIKVNSWNPLDVGRNHQVLAYGYDLDPDTGDLTIQVYDPNCPNEDTVTLSLNMANPNKPSPITMSSDPAGRGFFRTSYSARDPAAALSEG